MNRNKIVIVINKPLKEVFEFTTNPKNTHLWIPQIKEELSDKYPQKSIQFIKIMKVMVSGIITQL